MNAYEWFGVAMALLVFGFGLYKWIVSRGDQARANVNNAQDRTLDAHQERLDRHREEINHILSLIQTIRDEMARSYVRTENLEKLESSLDEKMERIHSRLSGIARDLNQTIGSIRAAHDAEIKAILEKFKDAVEKR